MPAPRKNPKELTERATRLAMYARRDTSTRRGAIARIAGQLDIHPEALRGWVRRAVAAASGTVAPVRARSSKAAADEPGEEVSDRQRILELGPKNRELTRANLILRQAATFSVRSSTANIAEGAVRRPPRRNTATSTESSRFIEALRDTCAEIASSTYYVARTRPASARTVADEVTLTKIRQVQASTYGVYGVRKTWRCLARADYPVARCTVERVMRTNGISKAKNPRTTIPGPVGDRPDDPVRRAFHADGPNQLWVAGIT